MGEKAEGGCFGFTIVYKDDSKTNIYCKNYNTRAEQAWMQRRFLSFPKSIILPNQKLIALLT